MPVAINYSIVDGKGKSSNREFYAIPGIEDDFTLGNLLEGGAALAQFLANLLTGQITDAYVKIPIPLGGLTSNAAPAGTVDVEEGAIATFGAGSLGQYPVTMRLATFDEAKVISGTVQVNLADTDVDNFVEAMENGIELTENDEIMFFTDSRDEPIVALDTFEENFRTRKRRR